MSKAKETDVTNKPRFNDMDATLRNMEARVSVLEAAQKELDEKQALFVESYKFSADALRNIFGMASLVAVLDGIYTRLSK